MRSEVTVIVSPEQEYRIDLEGVVPLSNEEARRWLDSEFVRLDCEPLRPSGKVLLADKVLVVARDAGVSRLGDREWLGQFARAVTAALSRPVVRIDLQGITIAY